MNKILFISIYSHLPYSEAIKKSLVKNGYTVYEPEYYEWHKVEDDKVVQEKQNIKYIEALSKYDIDWILVINHSYVNRCFFDECHEKGIEVFAYTMDSIRWCDYATDYLHDYAGIYSYEPSDCEINTPDKKIKYLPIGYDAEILYDEVNRKYKYDLCFVGSLDKKRIKILESVAKYAKNNQKKIVVYTSIQLKNFTSVSTFFKILLRRIKFKFKYGNLYNAIINKPIWGDELRNLYNSTKICLNINQNNKNPEWHTGINPRTFEIMGCKSFEIIDEGHLDKVEIINYKDIVEFNDENDLIDKIDYYLKHDEERNKIAENGYNIVRKKYTSDAIVKNLLDKITYQLYNESR